MFNVAALLIVLLADQTLDQAGGWGQPAAAQDLRAAKALLVMPDGSGLPEGQGDAAAGAILYTQHCQACHGERGSGGSGGALAGGELLGPNPVKTVGSFWPYAPKVFDYIRRAMPYGKPASLSDSDYYALTAYILYVNNIIGGQDQIDPVSLPKIVMPNRNGFLSAYPRRPEL